LDVVAAAVHVVHVVQQDGLVLEVVVVILK